MRMRLKIFGVLVAGLLLVCFAFARGEETGGDEDRPEPLTFEAGSNRFRKNPDGSFVNRLYNGVKAWHLDAELTADEGVYESDADDRREIRFYGGASFRDSLRRLTADTLVYYEDTRRAVAVGGVLVVEGGRTLVADRVEYRKAGSEIVASGAVNVYDDSTRSRVTGETASFNDSTGYGLIVGEPFLRKDDEDGGVMTVSCRDSLEIFEKERLIRLWRDVVAFKDSIMMSCSDTLVIDDLAGTIRLWTNVLAVQDSLSATADFAVYHDSTETLTLTGTPSIRYAVMDTRDEAESTLHTVSVVTGDTVRVVIHDKKITGAEVIGNAVSATTSIDSSGVLFDRSVIESARMRMTIENDFISQVSAEGTAVSYYHRNYKTDDRMIVNEAAGDTLTFSFDRGELTEMKIFGFGGGLGKGTYFNYEPEKAQPDSAKAAGET